MYETLNTNVPPSTSMGLRQTMVECSYLSTDPEIYEEDEED